MGQIPRTAGTGQGVWPLGYMAYEFNGYGNVKVAGGSAWALMPAIEHSRSYITGGPAGCPTRATGCHKLLYPQNFLIFGYLAQ